MALVICNIEEGLRPSEVTVEVVDLNAKSHYLRVGDHYIHRENGHGLLPIGVVAAMRHEGKDVVLIELPHESDSGANRLCVLDSAIRTDDSIKGRSP